MNWIAFQNPAFRHHNEVMTSFLGVLLGDVFINPQTVESHSLPRLNC